MNALALGLMLAPALAWAVYRWVVPEVVWWLYRRSLPHHRLEPPNIDEGAGIVDVQYWAGTYDCRKADLEVDLIIPQADYWMIGVYDCYARGLAGGHLCHRDVVTSPGQTMRIAVSQVARQGAWLDVSSSPRGLLVFRVLRSAGPVEHPALRECV